MPANPAEAEATGQEFVAVTFGGAEFSVPLDVDSWPLDTIRRCRGVKPNTTRIVVNHVQLVAALRDLLGDHQWPRFVQAAPRRRDHAPASQAFAAAVGIPALEGLDSDVVFGGIPRLLGLIDRWPDKVESDLDQYWHIDYRDRWRFDPDGCRRLTLRQIYVRLSNLHSDSALNAAVHERPRLSDAALVGMDVYEVLAGRRHRSRPMSVEEKRARDEQAVADQKAREEHKARMQKRKNSRQAVGVANARANARRALQGEVGSSG